MSAYRTPAEIADDMPKPKKKRRPFWTVGRKVLFVIASGWIAINGGAVLAGWGRSTVNDVGIGVIVNAFAWLFIGIGYLTYPGRPSEPESDK